MKMNEAPAQLPVEPALGRACFRHFLPITTRWMDNDIYGHMNNVVHYSLFDSAVNGWLFSNGLLDIRRGEQIGLVVETGCRYLAALSFPETAEIGLAVERLGTSSVTYRLGIFAEGQGIAVAEGEFTHVYVDRVSRKPTSLPAEWRAKLEILL